MIVIASLLRKLQALKDLVRRLSKEQRFETPFDTFSQTLVKSA